MNATHASRILLPVLVTGVWAGCSEDGTAPDETGELVVNASPVTPAPAQTASRSSALASLAPVGAPSQWLVGLYEFQISNNADCSGPFVTAFDSGGAPTIRDFAMMPQLFRAPGLPLGIYNCVAMRISDVMEFQSAVSSGACVAGTTYRGDVYRAGAEDAPFLDLGLGVITATGTEAAPSEDGIYVLFTTNPGAVTARGFAQNQVVQLVAPLIVPSVVLFFWDVSNAVNDGTSCVLEPEAPGLFL